MEVPLSNPRCVPIGEGRIRPRTLNPPPPPPPPPPRVIRPQKGLERKADAEEGETGGRREGGRRGQRMAGVEGGDVVAATPAQSETLLTGRVPRPSHR